MSTKSPPTYHEHMCVGGLWHGKSTHPPESTSTRTYINISRFGVYNRCCGSRLCSKVFAHKTRFYFSLFRMLLGWRSSHPHICKVDIPNSVTHLNWTLVFEWFLVNCALGMDAKILFVRKRLAGLLTMTAILGFIVTIIGRGTYMII